MNWFIYLFIMLFFTSILLININFKKNYFIPYFKNYIMKKNYVK